MNKKISLEPKYLKMTEAILQNRLGGSEIKVYVFGSRARNAAKETSDIDLALDGGAKLDYFKIICALKNDFEESDIKYSADIIDLNAIDESFKNHIKDDLIEIKYSVKKKSIDFGKVK
ncbi:MAG: nucleotidyltransferase domain-containing protein [Elusimicrobiota bacterium]|jgi:predicted nucleotidyltransferase|nr:nucleotidyltransferase domain-containing protein [Elusimicrobiota bacterium]